MRSILVLGIGLLLLPTVVLSQPEPGSRLRVDSKTVKEKVTGTLEAIREGRVVLKDPRWSSEARAGESEGRIRVDPPASFPIDDIEKMEVWRGRKTNVTKATLIGGGIGLAATVAILAAEGDSNEGLGPSNESAAIMMAVIGAAGGALVGLVAKTDRWEEVPFSHFRVGLAPPRAGAAGLAVRLSF